MKWFGGKGYYRICGEPRHFDEIIFALTGVARCRLKCHCRSRIAQPAYRTAQEIMAAPELQQPFQDVAIKKAEI